ncbi:MAG: GyrI-like domain-containing protein [Planctomycetes bacterium]|nr:GyrI-like domain-containing protein [Planctomycetota bacterium]
MSPEIITRDEFIVMGIRSVLDDNAENTGTLWKDKFLPRHNELDGADRRYYGVFSLLSGSPEPAFSAGGDSDDMRVEYVAGVVGSLENIPLGMVSWVIPAGTYAEMEATGLAGIRVACRNLIADWLPDSGYRMVSSPLFAYTDSEHPDSEQAVWKVNIPVETPEELARLEKWMV